MWSEAFLNYISEGLVSISTVLFVANPPGSIMFTLIVHPAQSFVKSTALPKEGSFEDL